MAPTMLKEGLAKEAQTTASKNKGQTEPLEEVCRCLWARSHGHGWEGVFNVRTQNPSSCLLPQPRTTAGQPSCRAGSPPGT